MIEKEEAQRASAMLSEDLRQGSKPVEIECLPEGSTKRRRAYSSCEEKAAAGRRSDLCTFPPCDSTWPRPPCKSVSFCCVVEERTLDSEEQTDEDQESCSEGYRGESWSPCSGSDEEEEDDTFDDGLRLSPGTVRCRWRDMDPTALAHPPTCPPLPQVPCWLFPQ